jgi:hypothetical protein
MIKSPIYLILALTPLFIALIISGSDNGYHPKVYLQSLHVGDENYVWTKTARDICLFAQAQKDERVDWVSYYGTDTVATVGSIKCN